MILEQAKIIETCEYNDSEQGYFLFNGNLYKSLNIIADKVRNEANSKSRRIMPKFPVSDKKGKFIKVFLADFNLTEKNTLELEFCNGERKPYPPKFNIEGIIIFNGENKVFKFVKKTKNQSH